MITGTPAWIGPCPSSWPSAPWGPAATIGGSPPQPRSRRVSTTACTHALAGERLAFQLEGAAGIRRCRADHAARCVEGALGGTLCSPYPLQLAGVLVPPARIEQHPVGRQRDALAAQVVRQRQREARRHRHRIQAGTLQHPPHRLHPRIVQRPAVEHQVAPAELVHHPDLGRGRLAADEIDLELVGDDDAPIAGLHVGERVARRDPGGDEHVGVEQRVGMDQQGVGHARQPTTLIASPMIGP